MNIIENGVILKPGTFKLVHCKKCDSTWADRKIPDICPHCGAKKNSMSGASEEQCESFSDEYSAMLESMYDPEGSPGGEIEEGYSESPDSMQDEAGGLPEEEPQPGNDSAADQTTSEYSDEPDDFEPIGYSTDSFMELMVKSETLGASERRQLLKSAESRLKETKWAMRRAGLPTEGTQTVLQDIRSRSSKLGANLPAYTEMACIMLIDTTLQHELRHPRKGKIYSIPEVGRMLKELEINPCHWDSYYSVAGLE